MKNGNKHRGAALVRIYFQPVANPRLRSNVTGTGGISFNLATQGAYINPQDMRLFQIGNAPDLLQYLAVGQHLAAMHHQQAQKIIFGWGQLRLHTINRHAAAGLDRPADRRS